MTLSLIAAFTPLVGAMLAGFFGWKFGRAFAHWSASGSVAIRGRAVSWTVTSPTATSQLVTLVAQRWGYQNMTRTVQDTLLLYLANRTFPS